MCCTERAQSIGQQCHQAAGVGQAAGTYQAACRRTARCAQDWIGADGPPSQQQTVVGQHRATKDDCRVPI